jgi:hypothetical protein
LGRFDPPCSKARILVVVIIVPPWDFVLPTYAGKRGRFSPTKLKKRQKDVSKIIENNRHASAKIGHGKQSLQI